MSFKYTIVVRISTLMFQIAHNNNRIMFTIDDGWALFQENDYRSDFETNLNPMKDRTADQSLNIMDYNNISS